MKTYIINNNVGYTDSWLAPWAGYEITIFKKGRVLYYTLFGLTDKCRGYFTKRFISKYLTAKQNEQH